ncbi:hypothetical protein TNCV_393091 [Trichonephila clavipes]|nr:hypothetical protein TNCV_393091 [Trichonephila clavipes]
MVDLLAKRGTDILQRSSEDLPLLSDKLEVHRICKKCFHSAATRATENKTWRKLLKPDCNSDSPRATAAVGIEEHLIIGSRLGQRIDPVGNQFVVLVKPITSTQSK